MTTLKRQYYTNDVAHSLELHHNHNLNLTVTVCFLITVANWRKSSQTYATRRMGSCHFYSREINGMICIFIIVVYVSIQYCSALMIHEKLSSVPLTPYL